jgi:hypothetical protein
VYPLAEVAVIVGLRLYKAVERVGQLSALYHDHSYGADARRLLIGGLKVDGYEVSDHLLTNTSAKVIKMADSYCFFIKK